MNKTIRHLLSLLLVTAAAYGVHYLVLADQDVSGYWLESGYSLLGLHTFGFVASLIVTLVIVMANWAMPEKLGFIFLGLVLIKAVASYIYIQDGLNKFTNDFIEYNFLAMFFGYLFFDVYIAFKVLNEADGKA